MSKRGPCKFCIWLRLGKICTSDEAERPTERGNLKPVKGKEVKLVERFFDRYVKKWYSRIIWKGCFFGRSGFKRVRA